MKEEKARRRPLRRALWSAAPALAALAVAVKLVSAGLLGSSAQEAFTSGQQDAVDRAASWLSVANVVEPYKAQFAAGDAHVLAGDFGAARTDFEAALRAGSGTEECKVRVNLVLTIEKLGDTAAGNLSEAARLYQEALDTAKASPPQCHEAGSSNAAGEGASLDSAADRLAGKISAGETPSMDAQQGSGDTPAAPQPEQLKQLEENAQRAQRERAEGMERGEYLRSPDSGPSVDRPW
ncbi:hypothetical protein [Paenarthrobacter sp. FR1]|uniref:hypothetical protein n=1 Tax=Paenarthrobacter sp. FR1 TaxID=3439548 RepID=UPI003DA4A655